MPNQWARSHRLRCQHGHKLQTINAKPMGSLSWASMSTRTQAPNYQCKTNGHDLIGFDVNTDTSSKLSMPNQWAHSHRLQCQHGHKLQTFNAKAMGMILSANMFQQGTNYFSQRNKVENIPTNFYLDIYVTG